MSALDELQKTQLDNNTKTEQLFKYLIWGYVKLDEEGGLTDESLTMLKQAAEEYSTLRDQLTQAQAERDALKDVAQAALKWRNEWPDEEDVMEAKELCACAICQLILACDALKGDE